MEKNTKWLWVKWKDAIFLYAVRFPCGCTGCSFICTKSTSIFSWFLFRSVLRCIHTSSTCSIIKNKVTCGSDLKKKYKYVLSWNRYYRLPVLSVHSYPSRIGSNVVYAIPIGFGLGLLSTTIWHVWLCLSIFSFCFNHNYAVCMHIAYITRVCSWQVNLFRFLSHK